MKLLPWFRFFRLPNLPTAPGDALAGAAVGLMWAAGGDVRRALAAGGAAFFLYLYGLADNDVVGAAADARTAPDRPIPRGEISLRAARVVRSACLLGALLVGAFFGLPPAWWLGAVALTGTIGLYNRVKGLWLMGLCRGVSVFCGAAAVGTWTGGFPVRAGLVLGGMALGWTLYVAAVTKLSEGEERMSAGLGRGRFLLGLSAWAPLVACAGFPDPRAALLPLIGCLWTFVAWCAAVAPLGAAHGPDRRRAAVGRTIGALLYLQIGFMLAVPRRELLVAAVVLWLAARMIRRFAPTVRGS